MKKCIAKYLISVITFCLLGACGQDAQKQNDSSPKAEQSSSQGASFGEHIAGAAVAGASAGAAGAVAHNLTNRAMDRIGKKRRAHRIYKRRAHMHSRRS